MFPIWLKLDQTEDSSVKYSVTDPAEKQENKRKLKPFLCIGSILYPIEL